MKNINKPEFDFKNNNCCFDYSITWMEDTILGSAYSTNSDLDMEVYYDFYDAPYYVEDFLEESEKLIKRFLRLDNKKTYEEDTIVYAKDIELYNRYTDSYDIKKWELKLSYKDY